MKNLRNKKEKRIEMKSDRMPLGGVFHSALKFGAQALHLIYISSFLHGLEIAAARESG
jgi:hypothetical protein